MNLGRRSCNPRWTRCCLRAVFLGKVYECLPPLCLYEDWYARMWPRRKKKKVTWITPTQMGVLHVIHQKALLCLQGCNSSACIERFLEATDSATVGVVGSLIDDLMLHGGSLGGSCIA